VHHSTAVLESDLRVEVDCTLTISTAANGVTFNEVAVEEKKSVSFTFFRGWSAMLKLQATKESRTTNMVSEEREGPFPASACLLATE
jgi:hypothetical protein